ncbi:MAG: peptidase, partial [Bacteroidetes bacterium]|nr:peptidase [Bacteroidota bacterium]
MKRILFSSILILCAIGAFSQVDTIEKQLFELPDLIFKPIESPEGFEAAYELHIKQPLDHENPEQGHFYQRAYLSHRSFEAPMVLATEGYSRPSNRMYELTNYLQANQLDVEHRYFGSSVPDSLDYRFLNLKQVAGDLHRIRTLL